MLEIGYVAFLMHETKKLNEKYDQVFNILHHTMNHLQTASLHGLVFGRESSRLLKVK
jgi:hypothetical protein